MRRSLPSEAEGAAGRPPISASAGVCLSSRRPQYVDHIECERDAAFCSGVLAVSQQANMYIQSMTAPPTWVTEVPPPIRDVLSIVTFLPWFDVADFDSKGLSAATQSGLRRSGTYVVGVFDDRPPGDPLVRNVHYIGMTKGENTSLAARIAAFVMAARGGDASHSGGHTWFREGLTPKFWISAAPSIDLRACGWSTQSWSIWPEVVEKALLMAYAHRHGVFPRVNIEWWTIPTVTAEMVDGVASILEAEDVKVIDAARDALPKILAAWGYQPKKIYDDTGRHDPAWIGLEAPISKGYWLWIGREQGKRCHIGIWRKDGSCWDFVEIRRQDEIAAALSRVPHSWHTSAGLL
jgi:hypothetical protein